MTAIKSCYYKKMNLIAVCGNANLNMLTFEEPLYGL